MYNFWANKKTDHLYNHKAFCNTMCIKGTIPKNLKGYTYFVKTLQVQKNNKDTSYPFFQDL